MLPLLTIDFLEYIRALEANQHSFLLKKKKKKKELKENQECQRWWKKTPHILAVTLLIFNYKLHSLPYTDTFFWRLPSLKRTIYTHELQKNLPLASLGITAPCSG